MRLLRSSLLKVARRPATLRVLAAVATFLVLIYVSLGASSRATPGDPAGSSVGAMLAFPGAQASLAGMLFTFCGMAGAAYAGVVVGAEWSWNTFRVALTRGEARGRYVVSLFVAIGLLVLAAWVVLFMLGDALIVLAAMLGGTSAGNPLDGPGLGTVAALVASGGLAVLMEVAIGFGVAFVARSSVAGIATVVGLFFAEQLAQLFVPADLLRFAPISAAAGLISAAGNVAGGRDLAVPLVVTMIYLVVAVAVAALSARRAEVA